MQRIYQVTSVYVEITSPFQANPFVFRDINKFDSTKLRL